MKARVLGRCVTFNGSFAFLRPIYGDGKDVFAHESELPDGTISVGDKCTFDVSPDRFKPKRLRATNVRLVEDKKQPKKRPKKQSEIGPGMYGNLAASNAKGAMADGLRKLLRRGQEKTKL
jgi:cold shock CspA family protein